MQQAETDRKPHLLKLHAEAFSMMYEQSMPSSHSWLPTAIENYFQSFTIIASSLSYYRTGSVGIPT